MIIFLAEKISNHVIISNNCYEDLQCKRISETEIQNAQFEVEK